MVLRSVNLPDDDAFLKQAFFSTRTADAEAWSVLSEAQVIQLLEMQYNAQQMQYAQDFPDAVYSIVTIDGKDVGRLITSENESVVCGVDLAILPEFRSLGIGTVVIRNLMNEAAQTERIFKLQVLKTNRAIGLYKRLGCEIVAETESHFAMEWRQVNL